LRWSSFGGPSVEVFLENKFVTVVDQHRMTVTVFEIVGGGTQRICGEWFWRSLATDYELAHCQPRYK
jgi:hypothetical protein